MRLLKLVFYMLIFAALASCTHGTPSNNNDFITVNGRLEPNPTIYTYGTNLLVVSPSTSYFVESTSLTLLSFEGDSVQAILKDMGSAKIRGLNYIM